jgi:hypothetical protein
MRTTIVTGLVLAGLVLAAGQSLALIEATEIVTSAGQSTADSAANFAVQMMADVEAKGALLTSVAVAAANNAGNPEEGIVDIGEAASTVSDGISDTAATAIAAPEIANSAWAAGKAVLAVEYAAVQGFTDAFGECAWESFSPTFPGMYAGASCAYYASQSIVAA